MGLKVANILEEGRWGGPQTRVLAVAERLREKGIETTVILPKIKSRPFEQKLRESSLPMVHLRMHSLSRDPNALASYVVFFLPELISLMRVLGRVQSDIVHCNGAWQIKGIIAAKLLGMRVIWHLNDTRRVRIIQSISEVLCRYFCDYIIFASQRTKSFYVSGKSLKRVGSCEIQAPVDTALFNPEVGHIQNQDQRRGTLTIATTGNINPAKGLEYFIEMASMLNGRLSNLEFMIIGNCFGRQRRYKRELIALARRLRVNNLKWVQGVHDVRPYLRLAKIYVCASVHEASPISVWEAMSMKRAIVATDVGDVSSFIRDGESGFVVAPGDPRSLADRVETLVSKPALRSAFGKAARQTAIEKLDVQICAERHAEVYTTVIQRTGRAGRCIS